MNKILNGLWIFIKTELLGIFIFCCISLAGIVAFSWHDEENIEQCMRDFPERTYTECESAVVW